jgi:hypothetical protein
MVVGVNDTDVDSFNYTMSYDDYSAMASTTSAVASVSEEPTGYLTVSQYTGSHCNGEISFEFSYPVGVCVNYGSTSEEITVVQVGNTLIILIARYHGTQCNHIMYSHAVFVIRDNLCAAPFELSFTTELPVIGQGVVSE